MSRSIPLGEPPSAFDRTSATASGVCPLADGRDAFAARVLLADAAEHTLDAQYYIWHADRSGTLLFDALRRAADRGVRVRLLLDDNNTRGLDPVLAALDAHENIEVRLFNPFRFRRWRVIGYFTDFARLNRRMHNKSFTVDRRATVVGGRNVGDEYFGADQRFSFVDLDVLATGPAAADVSHDFDRYWASASAVPAACVLRAAAPADASRVREAGESVIQDPASVAYVEAVASSPFARRLRAGELPVQRALTTLLSDDPAKGLGRAAGDGQVWPRLTQVLGVPWRELRLVSAYFVPGARGVALLTDFSRRGVNVQVLTNSLSATDVPAVHAGYAKWRKALVHAGVTLFELKRAFSPPPARGGRLAGSSPASLHAKTFAVDGRRVFVGSFNFDPRSARLNTEMGLVIECAEMAKLIEDAFHDDVPARAYEVRLADSGRLRWVERCADGETVHAGEPATGAWRRAAVSILSRLPIEWLL